MAFKDVGHSFAADVTVAVAAPVAVVAPLVAVVPLGLGAPAVLGGGAAPPYLVSLMLQRTLESTQVRPGYGLASIALAPIDATTAVAPVAFVFGDHSQSFSRVAPPANGDIEHFMVCPGDGNPVKIRWAVQHAAAGMSATLELFRSARPTAPIWSRLFANAGGVNLANTAPWVPGAPVLNTTYYECDVPASIETAGAGIVAQGNGFFPGGFLENEHGPYKFVLTINAAGNVHHRRAWTYFNVPAHKYKLVRYVPSTELGRFGIEFDPSQPDLRLISKAYFAYETSVAFPIGHDRHTALCDRIFQDWSAKSSFRVGSGTFRPLVFIVNKGHGATAAMPVLSSNYAATITPIARASEGDFPIVLTNRVGGSGVIPSPDGHFLRLYDPSAFAETESNPARKVQVYEKDIATIKAAIAPLLATAPSNVRYTGSDFDCSVLVGMPEHAVDPDAPTDTWLRVLATSLNGAIPLLSGPMPVLLRGLSKAGSGPRSSRTQSAVARVKAILSRTLQAPPGGAPAEASAMREAGAGFCIGADTFAQGAGVRRAVRIDFGQIATGAMVAAGTLPPFPYTASVHEFGHVFGYPDEYMDYNYPGNNCFSIWRSQPRIDALAAMYAVPTMRWPVGNTHSMNPNLMSFGTVFHPRYYLTFVEGLAKLLHLGAANATTYGPPVALNGTPATYAPIEEPAFLTGGGATGIGDLLRLAADAFEAATAPPLLTRANLTTRIMADAAAGGAAVRNLLYLTNLDSDVVVPALATGQTDRRHFVQTAVVRDDVCLHAAVQVEALRPILKLDPGPAQPLDTVPFPAVTGPRIKVSLRAVRAFTGSAYIQFAPLGIVQAFTHAAGGVAIAPGPAGTALITAAGAGELGHAAGQDIWLEGVAQGTTTMTLELVNAVGAVIAIDSVPIICGPPAQVMIDGKPIGASLAIPLQASLNGQFARTRIQIKKADAGLVGAVLVRLAKVVGTGDVTVYAAAAGGAALVLPYDIPNVSYNADIAELFIEGTTGTTVVDDSSLTFAIGGGAVFTTVNVTVVNLVNFRIEMTDTAPLTARTVGLTPDPGGGIGAKLWTDTAVAQVPNAATNRIFRPHLANQGFNGTAIAVGNPTVARQAAVGSDDFAVNRPLVLVEGSFAAGQNVSVTASVRPLAFPGTWIIERSPLDNAGLAGMVAGRALPTLANAPGVPVATEVELAGQLTPDHVGSFHLRLTANNGRDKLMTLNVVLVRVKGLNLDESRARVPAVTRSGTYRVMSKVMGGAAGDQHIAIQAGDWVGALNTPTESKFGCVLRGTVQCIGGGADGRLGQDCIFIGWLQNITSYNVVARYSDTAAVLPARQVVMQVGTNRMQGVLKAANHDHYFNAGAALVRIQPGVANGTEVMLDTGRNAGGGGSATLSRTTLDNPVNDDVLGWRLRSSAADSPGTEFYIRHPNHPTAFLTGMDYRHVFKSYLAVWADGTAPPLLSVNNPGHIHAGAGNRVFGIVGDLEWTLDGAWNVAVAAGGWTGAGNGAVAVPAASVTVHRNRNLSVTINQPFAPRALVPAAGVAEVKAPTMLNAFGWEASW